VVIATASSTTVCIGDSVQLLSSPNGGMSPYSYSWKPSVNLNNPSLQNPHAAPTFPTNYTVTVTDAYGCTADTSETVFVQSMPYATWGTWTPTLSCDGYVIPLKANVSSNGQTVIWNFGDGTGATTYPPNTNGGTHIYQYNNTYNISIKIVNSPCQIVLDTNLQIPDVSKFIKMLPANVFTPNGSGPPENECFHAVMCDNTISNGSPCVQDTLVENFKTCVDLEVYDRWGTKVFSSTDTKKCWDGNNMNGSPEKEGTYYYIVKFREMVLKGYVELLR
jgi:gliding motility-associated-like protein